MQFGFRSKVDQCCAVPTGYHCLVSDAFGFLCDLFSDTWLEGSEAHLDGGDASTSDAASSALTVCGILLLLIAVCMTAVPLVLVWRRYCIRVRHRRHNELTCMPTFYTHIQ